MSSRTSAAPAVSPRCTGNSSVSAAGDCSVPAAAEGATPRCRRPPLPQKDAALHCSKAAPCRCELHALLAVLWLCLAWSLLVSWLGAGRELHSALKCAVDNRLQNVRAGSGAIAGTSRDKGRCR